MCVLPRAPAAPPPPEPPPEPTKQASSQTGVARDADLRRRALAQGLSGTRLTGGLGLTSQPLLSGKTLLGQ